MLDRAAGEALLAKLDEFAAELARFRAELVAAMPVPVVEGNGLDVDDLADANLLDTTSAQERFGFAIYGAGRGAPEPRPFLAGEQCRRECRCTAS